MILNEVEKTIKEIETESNKVHFDTFQVAANGTVVLKDKVERYNVLTKTVEEIRAFETAKGSVIKEYEALFNEFGKPEQFIEFLEGMAKINPAHQEVIQEYLSLYGKVKEVMEIKNTEPVVEVEAPVIETPAVEVPVGPEPVVSLEDVLKPIDFAFEPMNSSATQVDEPVVASVEQTDEAPAVVIEPVVEASPEPLTAEVPAEELSAPVVDPSTLVINPFDPATASLEELASEEEKLEEQLSVIKEAKKKRKVAKRRKFNWKNLGSKAKKFVSTKGIVILENTKNRSASYRENYMSIVNLRASYKSATPDVNNAEIDALNQRISSSEELTIEEKSRLMKKLSKLAHSIEKNNKKQQAQALEDSQAILESLAEGPTRA